MTALIRKALVRSMAERAGVITDGRDVLWEKAVCERRKETGKDYLIHNAVVVFLRRIANKSYVVLKPTVWIKSSDGSEVPDDVERNLKMAILGCR
jgi:hypothetical protein